MSFLSAQGSNATFNNTVVNDLTIKGKLTIVQDTSGSDVTFPDDIKVNTITSIDETNKIDLSVANQLNLHSSNIGCFGQVELNSTTNSTSPTSGSLIVNGGLGCAKDVNIGGKLQVVGDTTLSNVCIKDFISGEGGLIDFSAGNQLHLAGYGNLNNCKQQGAYMDWNNGSGDGKLNLICNRGGGHGGFTFYNVSVDSSGNVDYTTPIIDVDSNTMKINSVTDSSGNTNGALVVLGGAGIDKNLNVGGNTQVTGTSKVLSTLNSTSKTTGAMVVVGGLGVNNDVYVGGNVVVTGSISSSNSTNYQEFHSVKIQGNMLTFSGVINLNNGGQGNSNYMVFPSVYYGTADTGAYFNQNSTSGAIGTVVVSNIVNNSFWYSLSQTDNNKGLSIYLVFWVVFSSQLNFPKYY